MTVQVSAELLRRAADVLEAGISNYALGLSRDLRAAAGEDIHEPSDAEIARRLNALDSLIEMVA
jgi:hypothetical protein